MKSKTKFKTSRVLGTILGAATLSAGLTCMAADETAEVEKPFVTGTLSLVADTHFVSYGADVWGAGNEWDDLLFHPSIELVFDLGGGFSAIGGLWFDINDNATSDIGDAVQEVDAWIGLSYGFDKWKFTLLYQEWMYAKMNERIIDFKVGYAHWLNPSLTFHARPGGAGFEDGLVTVLGIAPSHAVGPVTFSFPVNVSFDTDEYHGGDAGYGFVSVGVGASVPLTFMRGNWSFNAGLTFYHTNEDVIPGNVDENFLTGSAGLTLAF